MSVTYKTVCDQFFGADFHDFNQTDKNKIDFGEVVILDTVTHRMGNRADTRVW